jgi:hypothetical protein
MSQTTKFRRMDRRARQRLLNALNSTAVSILIRTQDGRLRRMAVTRTIAINGQGGNVGPATADDKSITVYELNEKGYRTINTTRILEWKRYFGS